jgi:DnaJ-class molecular chaperone
LRIPGKGEMGPSGKAGDLFLRIHVRPHRYFRRKGNDLHLDLPVTVSEAALGTSVEVPTLDGQARLKIPRATQNGAKLRMKGKGIHSPKGGVHGDMFVHVNVAIPKHMDGKARKLFEELKSVEQNPREGAF